MERNPFSLDEQPGAPPAHEHGAGESEWAETLARTVAHLAAQLTVTQLRLRALASALDARGLVEPAAVETEVRHLAATDADAYLRENLGEALAEVIDVDALAAEIVDYLAPSD